MVYHHKEVEDNFRKVHVELSADHAVLFAYLDRYSAKIDRTGAYEISLAAICKATSFCVDAIREMLPALAPYGIHYDFDSEVVISDQLVLQCAWWAKENQNNKTSVTRHLAALGLTPLSHHSLHPLNRMEGNRTERECIVPDTVPDIVPDIVPDTVPVTNPRGLTGRPEAPSKGVKP